MKRSVASIYIEDHGSGPVVALVHGFPDTSVVWRRQIGPIVAAGFRVLAVDLPGFGRSARPLSVRHYAIPAVARRFLFALDELEVGTVHFVGHDWGAALGWYLAAYFPERTTSLAALGAGCPGTSGLRSIEQREKFWHFHFFQFRGVAEAWLRHDHWKLLREWARGEGDVERWIKDLGRPGALTAALNWYRANLRPELPTKKKRSFPMITRPVLGVWAVNDHLMTENHVKHSDEAMLAPWTYRRIEAAGHWMMLDNSARVNSVLLDFLTDQVIYERIASSI